MVGINCGQTGKFCWVENKTIFYMGENGFLNVGAEIGFLKNNDGKCRFY